eukprot:scaffold216454_cov42-Prasinocladus_malaysianus.AAC.2
MPVRDTSPRMATDHGLRVPVVVLWITRISGFGFPTTPDVSNYEFDPHVRAAVFGVSCEFLNPHEMNPLFIIDNKIIISGRHAMPHYSLPYTRTDEHL